LDLTLQSLINHADFPISLPMITHIAKNIATALDACRAMSIVHRDVKPGNILISLTTGEAKLCDFGLAKRLSSHEELSAPQSSDVGTMWYKPIEILLNTTLQSHAMDIWSVGCVIGEMHRLRPLFAGSVAIQQLYLIQDCLGPISTSEWPTFEHECRDANLIKFDDVRGFGLDILLPDTHSDLLNIISKCLIYNPSRRISPSEILSNLESLSLPQIDFISACRDIINKSSLTLYKVS
jgi:serine/threonine protein kinase